jgi:hypothetical protein
MKPQTRMTAKKILGMGLAVMAVLFAGTIYAANEFHFNNDFGYTFNDVSGPGGDTSSSLTRGWRYLNVFGATANGTYKDIDYNFNLGVKGTDDRRNDPTTWSLTNLQARATNKIHTLNAGDTFESFSQYSLSTSVKGGSYKYFNEQKNSPEITAVYGYAFSRWDNIYGGLDTRAIAREVYGMRVKQNFTPKFYVGVNFVEGRDVSRTRLSPNDPIYDSTNYSVDAQYQPIQGLTFRGEYSYAHTNLTPGEGQDTQRTHGAAYKLEAIGDGGPSRVSLEYEKVAFEYFSLLGSATPDREKAKGRWRYKWTKNMDLNMGILWYRDNLDGQKAYRTDHYTPDIGLNFRNVFGRATASADVVYRFERLYGGSSFVQNAPDESDHIVTLNYRDRFWEIDWDSNFGYSFYNTERNLTDRREYIYNLSLNTRQQVRDVVLKPVLYVGGQTIRDELAYATNQVFEYSIGMGIEIPQWKITSDMKIGQNRLENSAFGTDNSTKTFANLNVFYKPAYLAKMNTMLYLRSYMNDFRYSNYNVNPANYVNNNFRETSITMGVSVQY